MSIPNKIPGLLHIPNFLTQNLLRNLPPKVIDLQKTIRNAALTQAKVKTRTYLSHQHNLASEETYQLISLQEGVRKLSLQYFNRYGSCGHELNYFIGTHNIPHFIHQDLIPQLEKLPEVSSLKNGSGHLNWNATINTYSVAEDRKSPEFPFHKDVASNGDISAILSLGSPSLFELRKEGAKPLTIPLLNGSLTLISKEARWDWEHRVLSMPTDRPIGSLYRMSIVLGCAPKAQYG